MGTSSGQVFSHFSELPSQTPVPITPTARPDRPMSGSPPSPQLLEEYSRFFRLLSEPARLQLLCHLRQEPKDVAFLIEVTGFSQSHISRQLGQLQRAGLVRCERDGVRTIWQADDPLVEDLCNLVQNRLRQRLEAQLQQLHTA
jgi:DNA-binding transcriptional ArsR family regulator